MSLQQGSFALTRYRVLGREKNLSVADLNRSFYGFQAAPISLSKSAYELRCGWTLPLNPELEQNPENSLEKWDISDCLFEDGILLRFRIERKTVPAQLLQAIALQRWQSSERQDDGDNPLRIQKKQIVDEVREELLQMALPSITFVDAYWKDQDDLVYLFSQSKMARDCFEELFRKSFGAEHNLSLFKIMPPLLGLPTEQWSQPDKSAPFFAQLTQALPVKTGSLSIS